MLTVKKLVTVLGELTDDPYFCIAYSGGMDSHVLLYAMAECQKQNSSIQVRALHINHHLNSNSNQWEDHCKKVAQQLGIPFHVESLRLMLNNGDSIEAVARKMRYDVLQNHVHDKENILTAHTQNDQAETFLLQLLRGAGVRGLSGMPLKKKLGRGYLLRPLLSMNREDLKTYAKKNHLHWIEDDMNFELRFNRNYLRHEVFPILRRRWPKVFSVISRSTNHCAEAAHLLDQSADINLQTMQMNGALAIRPLLQLTPEQQRNTLRRWIYRRGFSMPQTKQLEQMRSDVLAASADAVPVFVYDDVEIRRFGNALHISTVSSSSLLDTSVIITWNLHDPLYLPGTLGVLRAVKKKGKGISTAIDIQQITVRFRRGGERCQPAGRKETHSLKKLMQEWKIPSWQRNRIPLIYYDGKLITVVDYCICGGFAAKNNEFGWVIKKYKQLAR
ncbi:tRNA lysidine(34) synthetase TilS [Coxiella endosymbiont of Amblyomma nuttalli]|uniref:tRNA lysidine(34) synthetase TilS n=1 Tax=Coxiella endosymbiont of Amblyomma nuttalli TaxID=2749996 RepID=UPI001BB67CCB|nr:tRNA lysidine(34) synthetase TilS [Coxiella endosymbiont of Amblyomma nuttalli]QTS83646.1 tRNA(Ile)-lysidine synthase [Coxiella endosymbiont of Amblyomma nuttalli]